MVYITDKETHKARMKEQNKNIKKQMKTKKVTDFQTLFECSEHYLKEGIEIGKKQTLKDVFRIIDDYVIFVNINRASSKTGLVIINMFNQLKSQIEKELGER